MFVFFLFCNDSYILKNNPVDLLRMFSKHQILTETFIQNFQVYFTVFFIMISVDVCIRQTASHTTFQGFE